MSRGVYKQIDITKESLDTVEKGDYFKYNDSKRGMKVMAVSENYFIICTKAFSNFIYSICHKNPIDFNRNKMEKGFPIMSPDNHYCKYDYSKPEECEKALIDLEKGDLRWSRYGVKLETAFLKGRFRE